MANEDIHAQQTKRSIMLPKTIRDELECIAAKEERSVNSQVVFMLKISQARYPRLTTSIDYKKLNAGKKSQMIYRLSTDLADQLNASASVNKTNVSKMVKLRLWQAIINYRFIESLNGEMEWKALDEAIVEVLHATPSDLVQSLNALKAAHVNFSGSAISTLF